MLHVSRGSVFVLSLMDFDAIIDPGEGQSEDNYPHFSVMWTQTLIQTGTHLFFCVFIYLFSFCFIKANKNTVKFRYYDHLKLRHLIY